MVVKKVLSTIHDGYVVDATIENFTYRMDYKQKAANGIAQGTSPTGLIASALSGCHIMTAKTFLDRNHFDYTQLEIEIIGDFHKENFKNHLMAQSHIMTDAKLNDDDKAKFIAFIEKYCAVNQILSKGDNEITIQIVTPDD